MLIAVQRDLFEHPAPHRTRTTAQIIEALPRDRADHPVESTATQPLESASDPRPTSADCKIARSEGLHQSRDVRALHLVVRRQGNDRRAGRTLEARHQRRRLAKAFRETEHRDVAASGLRAHQTLQVARNARFRTVQHDDPFIGNTQSIQSRPVVLHQRTHVCGMAFADRYDHRNSRRGHRFSHVRHRFELTGGWVIASAIRSVNPENSCSRRSPSL